MFFNRKSRTKILDLPKITYDQVLTDNYVEINGEYEDHSALRQALLTLGSEWFTALYLPNKLKFKTPKPLIYYEIKNHFAMLEPVEDLKVHIKTVHRFETGFRLRPLKEGFLKPDYTDLMQGFIKYPYFVDKSRTVNIEKYKSWNDLFQEEITNHGGPYYLIDFETDQFDYDKERFYKSRFSLI